ncbi:MAG: PH domain-containing protein [Candidatus Diapherotrites archaeon]|nr:PH domain-containing protein [Candidatus Diapherotrites archaeon]
MAEETFRPSLKSLAGTAFGFLLAFLWLFAAMLEDFSPLFLFGFLAILAFFFLVIYLRLINTWFVPKEDGLLVKRGIIAKSQSLLLYKEIQDVRERRGLFDRFLGLKSLEVVTISPASAFSGILASMEFSDADRLKGIILSRMAGSSAAAGKAVLAEKGQEKVLESPFKIHAGLYVKAGFFFWLIPLFLFLWLFPLAILLSWIPMGEILPFFIGLGALMFALISISALAEYLELNGNKYRIGKDFIQIERKFISQSIANIRFDKVQDLILTRGILERLIGLATLRVQTGERIMAASSGSDYYSSGSQGGYGVKNNIPAIKLKDALALREMLSEKIGLKGKLIEPALVKEIPLEKRKPLKKTVKGAFFVFIVLAVIVAWFSIFPILSSSSSTNGSEVYSSKAYFTDAPAYAAIIFVIFAIAKFLYEKAYLKGYYYNIASDHLVIRKGVFNITEVIIPFKMVQNVFLDQDIFDRAFKLYDVHLSTITTISGLEGHIDGLSEKNASAIRDLLLRQIKPAK